MNSIVCEETGGGEGRERETYRFQQTLVTSP